MPATNPNSIYSLVITFHNEHEYLPINIADTLLKVAASPKKTIPDTAIGSLFSEPTME